MIASLFEAYDFCLLLAFIAFIQLIIWLAPIPKGGFGHSYRDKEAREVIQKLSPETLGLVKGIIRSNRKIEAIKLVRSETNAGLREAKDCVEKLSSDMAEES